jgi:tetratricopeptide (TPR) repeat protein
MFMSLVKKRFTRTLLAALLVAAALPFAALAQSQPPQKPPDPPPPPSSGESSSKKPEEGTTTPTPRPAGSATNPQDLPAFDPYMAMKNVEIGQYYLQKGNVDAAIDRFMDATKAQPTYAEPWRLLGEAYEKKSDWAESIKCYQKYLKIYPHAPLRKKIEDHIADLQKTQQRETQKRKGN